MTTLLDQYVARLANISPFNIHAIDAAKDEVTPWYEVGGPALVNDLILNDMNLSAQVQAIGAQIMHWGRMESQCRRVWAMVERQYRQWREGVSLDCFTPPTDPAPKGWKKPTKPEVEATYRSDPQYTVWQQRIERAEEAFNSAHAVLEGFRAKKDMLKMAVIRSAEDGAARLSV